MAENYSSTTIIGEILSEADLKDFENDFAQKLQITKIEHFDHVKESDLKSIGLSQPAARRLLKIVKDRRNSMRKTSYFEKKFRKNETDSEKSAFALSGVNERDATCLISRDDVKLMETLGEGSFGVVKRAIWSQGMGKKVDVAVKLLRSGEGIADDFIIEINSLHKLKHPNLIRLYGLVISKPLMMVVELCAGGSLLDRLRHCQKPVLLITQLISYAKQIVEGMMYLESKNLIHRDLATRNVLLADENEKIVKIGDFGLMRALQDKDDHYVMSDRKKVPFAWCPPEALKQRKFSHASDVWSFGVTLWEMLSFGEEPWCGYAGPEILQKISAGEILSKPDACSSSLYQLMRQCWAIEPSQRLTFGALKDLLKEIDIQIGHSKESQTGEGLLEIIPGDNIIVVDGGSDSYYWYGQNMRTRKFGKFVRKLMAFDSKVSQRDISHPIKGSFVHTGHGDGRGGESWGHPDKIDNIYLRNPMMRIDFQEENYANSDRAMYVKLPRPRPPKTVQNRTPSGPSQIVYSEVISAMPVPPKIAQNRTSPGPGQLIHKTFSTGSLSLGNTDPSFSTYSSTSSKFSGSNSTNNESAVFVEPGKNANFEQRKENAAKIWQNFDESRPPAARNQVYYAPVPDELPSSANELNVPESRFYDEVPQDPTDSDPFEVSNRVKIVATSQRYSQLYAPPASATVVNRPSPLSAAAQMTPPPPLPPPPPSIGAQNVNKLSPNGINKIDNAVRNMQNRLSYNNLAQSTLAQSGGPNFAEYFYKTRQNNLSNVVNNVTNNISSSVLTDQSETGFRHTVAVNHPQPQPQQPLTSSAPKLSFDNWNPLLPLKNPEGSTNQNQEGWTNQNQGGPANQNQLIAQQMQNQQRFVSSHVTANQIHQSNFMSNYNSSTWGSKSTNLDQSRSTTGSSESSNLIGGNNRTISNPDVSSFYSPAHFSKTTPNRSSFGSNSDTPSSSSSPHPCKQLLDMFDPLADKPPLELAEKVHEKIPFYPLDRCGQVLKRCDLDIESAVRELKTQKLVDMGLGDRDTCVRALADCQWNIETAASAILG